MVDRKDRKMAANKSEGKKGRRECEGDKNKWIEKGEK